LKIKRKIKLQDRASTYFIFLSLSIAVFISVVLFLTSKSFLNQQFTEDLKTFAGMAVLSIDGDIHSQLQGRVSKDDKTYQTVHNQLKMIRENNSDIRFVYTMRQNEDKHIVLCVGVDPDVEDTVHFENEYETASEYLMANFSNIRQPVVEKEYYTDEWGTWLTAYAPLYRSDGTFEAIVGIDVGAANISEKNLKFLRMSAIAFLICIPFIIFLARLLGNGIGRSLKRVTHGAMRIANGDLDFRVSSSRIRELDDLASTFNLMTSKLKVTLESLQSEAQRNEKNANALRESEQRLRDIGDNMAGVLFQLVFDEESGYHLSHVSARIRDILDLEPIDALENPFNFLNTMSKDERDRFISNIDESRYSKKPFDMIIKHSIEEKGFVWLRYLGIAKQLEDKTVWNGVALDITARQMAEEEFSRARALLSAVLDQMPSGVLIADADTEAISYVNSTVIKILEYQKGALQDVQLDSLPELNLYSSDGIRCEMSNLPLSKSLRDGLSINDEMTYITPDGDAKQLLVSSKPIIDDNYKIIAAAMISADITELKKAEWDRKKLEEKIWQTQKLESLGVLAGGIAHDFNNLLVGIMGNSSLLLDEGEISNSVKVRIEEIDLASRRAADLCKQMLAYSGKAKFVVRTLSLNQLVKEMSNLLKVTISKKVQLKYELSDYLPVIDADPTQLRQVIMNLLTNANEAIGEDDGDIYVRTGYTDYTKQDLEKFKLGESLQPGEYVYLLVKDSGCGMDEGTLEKIFDPFFTTKFTGHGLGMASVLGIIRGHHGSIHVESAPGVGTTFHVLLPISHNRMIKENKPILQDSTNNKGNILLVDDEKYILKIGTEMLERSGFDTQIASNGLEAMELIEKEDSKISCVILDLTMPKMDGEAVLKEMQAQNIDTPVILSSGYSEQIAIELMHNQNVAGFLQKPYRYEELIQAIRNTLTSGETV